MICPSCQDQRHGRCRYPQSCPCQHVPSENVQIVQAIHKDVERAAADRGVELEAKPLDMEALNRMFSAVSHIKLK